jgi:hypothetical protein
MAMIFAPPVRRTEYLVRRPARDWIGRLERSFVDGDARGDIATMSAALNNFAFLLFKADLQDEVTALCRAHYRAMIRSEERARYAVQPWINEGRIMTRRGAFAAARERLLMGGAAGAEIRVDGTVLRDLDQETIDVCRNVAIIDGFFLELAEHGVQGAERHLSAFDANDAILELALQTALARGDISAAEQYLDRLGAAAGYAPTLVCYCAAIAACRDDRQSYAKEILLLVALLDGSSRSVDDSASILHALTWLARLDRDRYDAVAGGAIARSLLSQAAALDDEELQCCFAGRRYAPLTTDLVAFDMAKTFSRDIQERLSLLPG